MRVLSVVVALVLSGCSGPLCGSLGGKRVCEGDTCTHENAGFCVDASSALKCVGGKAVAYSCDVCSTVNSNGDGTCTGIRPY